MKASKPSWSARLAGPWSRIILLPLSLVAAVVGNERLFVAASSVSFPESIPLETTCLSGSIPFEATLPQSYHFMVAASADCFEVWWQSFLSQASFGYLISIRIGKLDQWSSDGNFELGVIVGRRLPHVNNRCMNMKLGRRHCSKEKGVGWGMIRRSRWTTTIGWDALSITWNDITNGGLEYYGWIMLILIFGVACWWSHTIAKDCDSLRQRRRKSCSNCHVDHDNINRKIWLLRESFRIFFYLAVFVLCNDGKRRPAFTLARARWRWRHYSPSQLAIRNISTLRVVLEFSLKRITHHHHHHHHLPLAYYWLTWLCVVWHMAYVSWRLFDDDKHIIMPPTAGDDLRCVMVRARVPAPTRA